MLVLIGSERKHKVLIKRQSRQTMQFIDYKQDGTWYIYIQNWILKIINSCGPEEQALRASFKTLYRMSEFVGTSKKGCKRKTV